MAHEAEQQSSPHDLYRVAEEFVRSERRQEAPFDGATLPIAKLESSQPAPRARRHENGFLAAYGSVRPLTLPLTDREMAAIGGGRRRGSY